MLSLINLLFFLLQENVVFDINVTHYSGTEVHYTKTACLLYYFLDYWCVKERSFLFINNSSKKFTYLQLD